MLYLAVLLLGITAGLRAATPLAAISIGAYLGWINLSGTWAAFLGSPVAVVVLIILAILEYIGDQLPKTPSRKVPPQFITRVITGAFAGAALMMPGTHWLRGMVVGAIGAVIGTVIGADFRGRLAAKFGKDQPAALIEDAIAVVGAFAIFFLAKSAI